jgi:hypothetical protein
MPTKPVPPVTRIFTLRSLFSARRIGCTERRGDSRLRRCLLAVIAAGKRVERSEATP